ncbi:MAG: hypothetical protein M3Y54_18145, partial [Bacteroidota bacterium]|nr:hypothetical protein [Bacteroidota bacterium]
IYTFQIFDAKGEKIYSKVTSGGNTIASLLKPSPISVDINKKITLLYDVIEDANDSNLKDIINELINL